MGRSRQGTIQSNPNHKTNMKTGNGKIANLPSNIRDELNYRINDGEQGIELVAWLNAKPEVVEVIHERFDGLPISEQNLSEWRKRGYKKWLVHHGMVDEVDALSENSEVIAETGIDCEKLLLTLTAAYACMIQCWIVTPADEMTYKLTVYKNLTNGVIALRRAEIQKVRLEIERERLELLREKRRDKSASSSSTPASSTESASRETATSSSPARADVPEPSRSANPVPPSSDEPDSPPEPRPKNAGSLPTAEIPRTNDTGANSEIAASQEVPEPPVAPLKPTAPHGAPSLTITRVGGQPRNATPRNPLGLL